MNREGNITTEQPEDINEVGDKWIVDDNERLKSIPPISKLEPLGDSALKASTIKKEDK